MLLTDSWAHYSCYIFFFLSQTLKEKVAFLAHLLFFFFFCCFLALFSCRKRKSYCGKNVKRKEESFPNVCCCERRSAPSEELSRLPGQWEGGEMHYGRICIQYFALWSSHRSGGLIVCAFGCVLQQCFGPLHCQCVASMGSGFQWPPPLDIQKKSAFSSNRRLIWSEITVIDHLLKDYSDQLQVTWRPSLKISVLFKVCCFSHWMCADIIYCVFSCCYFSVGLNVIQMILFLFSY